MKVVVVFLIDGSDRFLNMTINAINSFIEQGIPENITIGLLVPKDFPVAQRYGFLPTGCILRLAVINLRCCSLQSHSSPL